MQEEGVKASLKCQESLEKIVNEGLATDWSEQVVYEPESMLLLQNIVAEK